MAALENSIRELRKQRGLTQEEFAVKIGVTRQTVIAIEKGGYVPSLELAYKIARVFNKHIEKIFTFAE
ncbi:MAG: helix-turn-helix transcriptional regulator [Patescibacteria group bacterium]